MPDLDPVFYVKVIPPGTTPVRFVASEKVVGFEYEDAEDKADKLKFVIDNFDLENFDDPLWRTGNKIEVSWGYEGRMSPVRTCSIQSVKGSLTLQVEALDDSANMHKVQRVRSFENVRRSDVARTLAEENGYAGDRQHIDDTVEVLKQVTQARMTDATLLKDMARREGFEWFVDFDGFHFHPKRLGQKPVRKFVYYTDPGRGDILSWNVENDIFSRGKTGAVAVQGRDPLKKSDIDEKGDNVTAAGRPTLAPTTELVVGVSARDGSAISTEQARTGSSGNAIVPTTEATKEAASRQAQGLYRNAQLQAAELTMECIGDPDLLAKSIIEIQGIGATISGLYYVKSVSHKVGDGYKMTVKCKRDGKANAANLSGSGSGTSTGAKSVPSQGSPNTGKAPEGGPGGELEVVVEVDPRTGGAKQTYRDKRGRDSGGKKS